MFGPAPWALTLDQAASPTPARHLAVIFLRAYAALQELDGSWRSHKWGSECTMKIFNMALVLAIALVALLVPFPLSSAHEQDGACSLNVTRLIAVK